MTRVRLPELNMDHISLPFLKTLGSILTWATFWLAIVTALVGWFGAQVRSEAGRRSDLRVATAEDQAAQATSTAATANLRAEELQAENLKTQERLVAAERSLEAERSARLELEGRIAPRTLTRDQMSRLKSSLPPLVIVDDEALIVSVYAASPTAEAAAFAAILADLMVDCGCKVARGHSPDEKLHVVNGLGIAAYDNPDSQARGEAFVTAFNDAGVATVLLPLRPSLKSSAKTDLNPYALDDRMTHRFNQTLTLQVGDRPS